jgi:hypothetical protein
MNRFPERATVVFVILFISVSDGIIKGPAAFHATQQGFEYSLHLSNDCGLFSVISSSIWITRSIKGGIYSRI